MDDVADLVVTPFRDIVEKGRTAVNNAARSQPMLKAAQNLVREGERALKRIEPLCKKHFDDYGFNFLAALRESDEIAEYRTKLTDLLWEFDDYVEEDSFDADKFAELQALSRTVAPKMYDILMRMRLESPVQFDSRHFMSQPSPPSSPYPTPMMLPPAVPTALIPGGGYQAFRPRDSVSTIRTDTRSLGEIQSVEVATEQLSLILDRTESHDTAPESVEPPAETAPLPVPEPVEEPPRPPSANPWDIKLTAVTGDGRLEEEDQMPPTRRPPVRPAPEPPIELSSPVSPRSSANLLTPRPTISDGSNRGTGSFEDYNNHDAEERHQSIHNQLLGYGFNTTQASRPKAPMIPEEDAVTTSRVDEARPRLTLPTYPLMPHYSQRPRQAQHPGAPEERHDNYSESHRNDSVSSPVTPGMRDTGRDRPPSIAESLVDPNNPFAVNTTSASERPATAAPDSQPGLELAPDTPMMPIMPIDDGLIPVEATHTMPLVDPPQRDCSIDNSSSFYLHKGFCQGAEEVIRGGIGVKKAKKQGISGMTVVARCTHCAFELDLRHIELDVNKRDEGNYTTNGIGYRLRFLQKSHLHTKQVDDVLYACVFCIDLGKTIDESDATVFTSTSALFSHLARHPRPLPDVPGIAVVVQEEVPPALRNDYDLHFRHAAVPHQMHDKGTEVSNHPTGVAKETARRISGQRLLPDRTPALQVMQGARITGLAWPSRYHGEWCFGWHDGVYASIPTDIVKLNMPPWSQIKRGGISRIQARARWKFAPKHRDKEDWLKFDKGEIITNITWSYAEHWCWAGTNSKGKWGIFPQVFIDTNTVQELTQPVSSDRASIMSNERSRSLSILPRFSIRHKSGRPASIAGSTSSGETTVRPGFTSPRSRRESGGDVFE